MKKETLINWFLQLKSDLTQKEHCNMHSVLWLTYVVALTCVSAHSRKASCDASVLCKTHSRSHTIRILSAVETRSVSA